MRAEYRNLTYVLTRCLCAFLRGSYPHRRPGTPPKSSPLYRGSVSRGKIGGNSFAGKSPVTRFTVPQWRIVFTRLRYPEIHLGKIARSDTRIDERASPAAIFRSRRYHIRESLPNMVNRGGPSFSNDHSARRDKTPIQLTVALPARLSYPSSLLPVCSSYFYVLTKT